MGSTGQGTGHGITEQRESNVSLGTGALTNRLGAAPVRIAPRGLCPGIDI